jgi:hypothetical protein
MGTAKRTVWVLTSEYNQYDQYGRYFLAVFAEKPTAEQLRPHIAKHYYVDEAYLEHVRGGGGRLREEDLWYCLDEEELL